MKTWQHTMITGGGSGLGLGLAERLVARGSRVTLLDLTIEDDNRTRLETAARKGGGEWRFLQTDITDGAGLRGDVEQAVQVWGTPDLAINSAGTGMCKAFVDTTEEEFRRVVDINLTGSFNFATAVLPRMRPNARLAFVASLAGLIPNYAYSAYGASKFGVVGLAAILRQEYQPMGIHISCVCPPEVKTPMVTAESAGGNPVGLELKRKAGSLDADTACDQILAGLDAGRWKIIPGTTGKLTAAAAQYLPGLFNQVTRRLIRRALRKQTQ